MNPVIAAIRAEPHRKFFPSELAWTVEIPLHALADLIAEAFRGGEVTRSGPYIRRRIGSDPPTAAGDFLWIYREASHLTQKQAGRSIGMHQSQWSDLEANRRSPTVKTLQRAATAIGRQVRDLL